jgi:hypothetical protein
VDSYDAIVQGLVFGEQVAQVGELLFLEVEAATCHKTSQILCKLRTIGAYLSFQTTEDSHKADLFENAIVEVLTDATQLVFKCYILTLQTAQLEG